jgi:hypothetical protein
MGRVPYNEEFGGGTGGPKFPRVSLVKDQKMRLICPEQPYMEWVHRLEAPEFQNGQPLKKKREGRNGEPDTLVWSLEWMGNPICAGAHETLRANAGLDPQNCQICAVSVQMNGRGVRAAQCRYAMNVLEYPMLPNGQLVSPFSLRVLIWAFTSRMYDKLVALRNEHGSFQDHDIILGPVEGPITFQKYPIEIGAQAYWQQIPNGGQVIRDTYTPANLATEDQLRDACGRRPSQYLAQDLERVQQRWQMADAAEAQANGAAPQFSGQLQAPAQQSLQAGFENVLSGGQPGGPAQPMYAGQQQAPGQSQFGGFPAQSQNGQAVQPAAAAPQGGNPFEQQPAAPQGNPFPVQEQPPAQQPDFAGQGYGQGFGQQPPATPQGNPFAPQQAAAPQQPAPQGNPFAPQQGAPAQAQQPFAGVQPAQPAPGQPLPPGLAMFQPMTQGQQAPVQPSLEAPPAQAAPQAGQSVAFGDLMNMGGQPQQGPASQ